MIKGFLCYLFCTSVVDARGTMKNKLQNQKNKPNPGSAPYWPREMELLHPKKIQFPDLKNGHTKNSCPSIIMIPLIMVKYF